MAARTRRAFLAGGAGALAAGGLLPGVASGRNGRAWFSAGLRARPTGADRLTPSGDQLEALRVLGRDSMRLPGSVPDATVAAGADTLPEVEHVVVVMMENHSYDNMLGMLGRGPFEVPRGDGFTIGVDGYPVETNPTASGGSVRAFRMPTTCQLQGKPSQEWTASHTQYAGGANSGFVASPSGPVAMGYWDRGQLPFTYDLATQFPIGDRWFCSLLGQTDPNRRFLIAATSSGMTDDIPSPTQDATLGLIPSNGTIFTQLTSHGISWAEYTVQYPSVTSETANLYPGDDYAIEPGHERPFSQFLTDAATGTLPSFSLVGPNFSTQSQEDPQNIALGEAFIAQVVMALGGSPKWSSTLLIIVYDEHGGYYDHVPPPVALAPDALPPVVSPGQSAYEGFKRYGFRVPAIVVGPYAKPGHVSHVVYDHTSILAFVERKWNLPALTLRDANANDLTDFLDLAAMRAGVPTFPELPALAAPGDTAAALACSASGPGVVPPARPAPLPIEVRLTGAHTRRARHEVVARVQASRTGLGAVTVALEHRGKRVAHRTVAGLTSVPREVVLRVGHGVLHPGHYAIVVTAGHRTLAHRALRVG